MKKVLKERDCGNLSYDVLNNVHNFNISRIHLGEKIPEGAFQALTQLETMRLYEVHAALPESIGLLSRLRYLRVRRSGLTVLPDSICKLPKLQNLDVCENDLCHLPEQFGDLCSLECCFLNRNALRELPSSIGKLSLLKHLEARENKLGCGALKSQFTQLGMLRHLDVSVNQLMMLPGGFDKLACLQHLDLSGNRLSALNFLDKLVELSFLDLSDNNLSKIPDINNPKLQRLNLSYNPGVETWRGDVETFKKLPALQELELYLYDDHPQIQRQSWKDKLRHWKFCMDLRLFSARRRCRCYKPHETSSTQSNA